MSQLVQLEGKHTAQTAQCALEMFERPQSGRLSPILKPIFIGQSLNQTPETKLLNTILFKSIIYFNTFNSYTYENISPGNWAQECSWYNSNVHRF